MQKPAEKSREFLDLMVDWEAQEAGTVEYADSELPKTKNPLIRTILNVLKLESEKHCLLQQQILDMVKNEAIHLTPEELAALGGHINRFLENNEKILFFAESALAKSEVFMPRYLLSYLVADTKKSDDLLRRFDDELKTAHIATSVSSKIYEK
jgi:DNA polymerase III psi subunit